MNFLIIFISVFTFALHSVSCEFMAECWTNEESYSEDFGLKCHLYFARAQEILTCGKKYRKNGEDVANPGNYMKCIDKIDIIQPIKDDLCKLDPEVFKNEAEFKKAVEAPAKHLCKIDSSRAPTKLRRIYGGILFNFDADIEGETKKENPAPDNGGSVYDSGSDSIAPVSQNHDANLPPTSPTPENSDNSKKLPEKNSSSTKKTVDNKKSSSNTVKYVDSQNRSEYNSENSHDIEEDNKKQEENTNEEKSTVPAKYIFIGAGVVLIVAVIVILVTRKRNDESLYV